MDKSTESGEHWVSFYLTLLMGAEFFDSYENKSTYFKGPISTFASFFIAVL